MIIEVIQNGLTIEISETGTQGPQGGQGEVGPQGPQGDQGIQGEQGIQGIQGETGPQGEQGIQGPQGDQGIQGIQGIQGDVGPQGDTGPQGIQGIQGDQGIQGPAGQDGVGIPAGGTAGQHLSKIDGTDYNTEWSNPPDISNFETTTQLNNRDTNNRNRSNHTGTQLSSTISDFVTAVQSSETDTTISLIGNTLRYIGENGANQDIDLSPYIDDTNLARITSASISGLDILTLTRDDASTVTVDLSQLNDQTAITNHVNDTNNPHSVTKTQVGLSNVPNVDATERSSHTGTQTASTISDFNIAVAGAETDTSLQKIGNTLRYIGEDGTNQDIDLSIYLDDTNLARLVSGTLNPSTGVLTVTRDDTSTFTIDLSGLLDNQNASEVPVTPFGNLGSTDVQSALQELQGDIDTLSGSAGEDNTASNIGTAGVGVFKQKTGVDLEFKKINAGSNKVSITDDVANNEIDIDVNQANLSVTASQVSDFDAEVSNNTDVASNTANNHTHANKAELDLITDGDHDVRTDNPHSVTKTQIGLSNVPNVDATLRSNHTGTQLASTISDFASSVRSTILTGISFAASTAITATDTVLQAFGKLQANLDGHKNDLNNPHQVTKTQVGLGNVDNTSDIDKPVSTAQANANTQDRARANHTGTQLASTISDIQSTITNNTEVLANTAKVTNATHTGEVTGSGVLTVDKTIITNKVAIAGEAGDYVLVSDSSDLGNLKKLDVGSIIADGSSGAILQALRTTSQALTATATNILFDTTEIETDDSILDHSNIDRERLIVKVSDYFFGSLNLELTNANNQDQTVTLEVRLNGTTTLSTITFSVTKSSTEMVNRTLFLPPVGINDYFSIRIFSSSTSVSLSAGARLCVLQLKGQKGPAGPQGADGDITWEGAWQTQDYVANQAVSYINGSSYVCHTNTTASQVPTDTNFWDILAQKGDVGTSTFTDYIPLFRQNTSSKQEPSATYVNQARYAFRGVTDIGISPTNIKIVARVNGGSAGAFRIYDITNATTICELTGISNTTDQTLDLGSLSNVTASGAVWQLQARNDGVNITFVSGVSIKYG